MVCCSYGTCLILVLPLIFVGGLFVTWFTVVGLSLVFELVCVPLDSVVSYVCCGFDY